MSSNREHEFEEYPKYKALYLKAFARMLKERERRGTTGAASFTSPESVMDWYLEKIPCGIAIDGQMDISDLFGMSDVD